MGILYELQSEKEEKYESPGYINCLLLYHVV